MPRQVEFSARRQGVSEKTVGPGYGDEASDKVNNAEALNRLGTSGHILLLGFHDGGW
ncbi:hypothetical protein SAMN06296036_102303 [Pseudobacteriovorax antillogorgiicola]|uniref:Uncharacterized protein n=1 Tax=Pseudobacteriovorax antillogorgiicola TaxID=1513793 RepID=A0A1Y6BDY8_9BACT|nr:hypothetical protein EDD56_102140 [Pseudobacteriovorax antillogorgiicola]SME96651.1 hypothetical protein SAMN06296036_102303 [Pseudobacteriovorax antillogorgiicola]